MFTNNPSLNVTPSYLAPEMIDFAPEGQGTATLMTATGVVTSPEPYQMVRVTIHLLRSQAFANLWKRQIEQSTLLGDTTVRPDSLMIDPFSLSNCSIIGLDRLNLGGREVGFVINLAGTWSINSALWT